MCREGYTQIVESGAKFCRLIGLQFHRQIAATFTPLYTPLIGWGGQQMHGLSLSHCLAPAQPWSAQGKDKLSLAPRECGEGLLLTPCPDLALLLLAQPYSPHLSLTPRGRDRLPLPPCRSQAVLPPCPSQAVLPSSTPLWLCSLWPWLLPPAAPTCWDRPSWARQRKKEKKRAGPVPACPGCRTERLRPVLPERLDLSLPAQAAGLRAARGSGCCPGQEKRKTFLFLH